MKISILPIIFLQFFLTSPLLAGNRGFEKTIPPYCYADKSSKLTLSETYYKEGEQSLEWNFTPQSSLYIKAEKVFEITAQNGIQLWIYNETAQNDSLRFEFLNPEGHIVCHFGFRLFSVGWRACWTAFKYCQQENHSKQIATCRIVAPNRYGRIFLDRLTFPVEKSNERNTPDMQTPYNNSPASRDLWHWCRTWEWEQYPYDSPLTTLTDTDRKELSTVECRLEELLNMHSPQYIKQAQDVIEIGRKVMKQANIRPSGHGFAGAPIVAPDDNLDSLKGDMTLNNLEYMLAGTAYDAFYHHSHKALEQYFMLWRYAIDQGFAYGSGMGTNHHYGYQIQLIYTSAWLLRKEILQSEQKNEILKTLSYWAALQETRKPCPKRRDELLDSWHTLLLPKTIAALMLPDERERARALKNLSRWVSTSLHYTPGTIGGIKIDGTSFHHGGFYPAYTSGALAAPAQFAWLTRDTRYTISQEGKEVLQSALIAMRNYCNIHDWGIGICGRHPFGSYGMKDEDIEAFAHLALAKTEYYDGKASFDHQLAADYLRLCNQETPLSTFFKSKGIKAANAPQGFFVYNYGATGIFRRNNWMVTLKGYNTDIWNAEIYRNDNRYGRYQSYGSIQIIGYSSPISSGFNENGWDWNRLPGTTTIHLPLDLLDCPLPNGCMTRSKENFSGCSSLEEGNGMFATKLMERELKNFTPDFVARKSAFCMGDRIICLGTGISNSNHHYPTETTLFQSTFAQQKCAIEINDKQKADSVFFRKIMLSDSKTPLHLKDGYENHYFIKPGKGVLKIQTAWQESRQNKTREITYGRFSSAWIDHGTAPQNGAYEYMIWIQPNHTPTTEEAFGTYQLLHCDNTAHIIHDLPSKITAYAVFDSLQLTEDEVFKCIPAETMIMRKPTGKSWIISICDPNLNILEKTYTTPQASRPIEKRISLNGKWKLTSTNKNVQISHEKKGTTLIVQCQHGQPVEFTITEL